MPNQYPVVIPAAGIGKRMQSSMPKQYLPIAGKTIIQHTIENLAAHPQISDIYVVLSAEDTAFSGLPIALDCNIYQVIGGQERVDSVLEGLKAVRDNDSSADWVLVHDAARPCVRHEDISQLLAVQSETCDGGILATRVKDTMKKARQGDCVIPTVAQTEQRDLLWHALTPQFFKLSELITAIETGLTNQTIITDEASAMEAQGKQVALIESNPSNIKITTPDDLALAEYYLTQQQRQ